MKRSHLWILVALLLVSCGGDDGAGPGDGGNNNDPGDPVPTAVGTPNGTPTTASIGPGGGTITSSDGLFSVTIPPAALASVPAASPAGGETEITIQPITNTAWGGVGPAYRLLPDGLEFAVPVELSFSLEDSLLWGSDTTFCDVATQRDDGVWGVLKSRRIDWESRKLVSRTSHFSDYSAIEGIQLRPAAASIAVLGTVNLFARYCFIVPVNDPDLVSLVYRCEEELAPLGAFSNWSVNGIAGGNGTVGTVAAQGGSTARYTAPATVPQNNPVAVSVLARQGARSQTLVSNITIGGVWWGTVTITQGTYSSVADVVWAQVAAYQGLETYRPGGTVHYEPDTDYGDVCWFVSMAPKDANINPDLGVLFIDWNQVPAKAYGYGEMSDETTICFSCEGWTAPECNTGPFPGWFAADSLMVNPNGGDSMYWTYTDYDQTPPKTMTVDFKKGLPPVPFVAKR